MSQYDVNLRDYWRILRRRKWVVAAVALAFGAMAYIFAEVQKPEPIYESTAVVKFERSTTLVGLLVETISASSGDSIGTQAAVVRSFPVLERAAKLLRMIPADLDSEAIKQNPRYIQLLTDLRGRVKAAPEENTTLINITVTSSNPAEATRVANGLAQAYREENMLTRNRQVREARRFIEDQLVEVGARLKAAEEGLRALKERRNFVSLSEETTSALGRLGTLETEYDRVQRTQQETASQIRALEDPQVVAGAVLPRIFTDAGDPTLAKLNATLLDLGVERENLLQIATPVHPQVRELNARIAAARENLVRELRLKVETFQKRGADLYRQIQQIRGELRILPDVALQYAQFQRDITLNENLLTQLRSKFQEVQIKEKEQVEEVTLVRPAIEPGRPINPAQTPVKGIVGLLIGLTIGLVLVFVLESLDTSIGTIQDVESYLEVPVLGLIPQIDPTRDPSLASPEGEEKDSTLSKMRRFLICLMSPKSTIAEMYRSLRTNIEFLSLEKNVKTLCVTSSTLMEGKTTTAINLATSMAQMGKKTLLVEADLRKPFIHHAFGITREPGLAEILLGNRDWHECLRTVSDLILGPLGMEKVTAVPNIDKLHILTSGTPPPNPAEVLNSQRMTDLIAAFRQEFDIVIFDCSPTLPVTDAAILTAKTDGALIVYRVGQTARAALKRAKVLLENVGGKILGVVLTGVRAEVSPDFEALEYYRYSYGHEPGGRTSARARGRSREMAPRASILLLIPLGLLLIGALAWWYGAWPTEWIRGAVPAGVMNRVLPPPPPSGQPLAANAQAAAETVPASAPAPSAGPAPSASAAPSAPAVEPAPASPAPQKSPETVEPARAYSLQVASLQDRAKSLAHAEALRAQGLDAFTVPIRIPGKGTWYRVLIGGFDSASSAAEAGRELQAKRRIRQVLVHSLPYAVEVDGLTTPDQAAEAVKAARRSGYLPMLRPDGGDRSTGSKRTLLVEAFGTPEEAERLADLLRTGGLSPRLVQR
jgi:succinoglycan biosynthesis transport protein ExoP